MSTPEQLPRSLHASAQRKEPHTIATSFITHLRNSAKVTCTVLGCGDKIGVFHNRIREHLESKHSDYIKDCDINELIRDIMKWRKPSTVPQSQTTPKDTNPQPRDPPQRPPTLRVRLPPRAQSLSPPLRSRRVRPQTEDPDQNDHLLWKQPSTSEQVPRSHTPRSINSSSLVPEWRIKGKINGFLIDALADTGANINAISKDEADKIGLVAEPRIAGKTIRLPSGKTCLSLGTSSLGFSFDGDQVVHSLRCNIVEKLEHGVILCYDFLQRTETLTRLFNDRIREVVRSGLRRFSLCLLDDHAAYDGIKARMDGFINGTRTRVVPDTGSGIMAVSASYARRLGLKIDTTRRTLVTFADGSSATTSGIVKAAWTFLPPCSQSELRPCLDDGGKVASADGKTRLVVSDTENEDGLHNNDTWNYEWEYEWHVIEDLPVDAILSLDFIKQHNIFGQHEHAFVRIPPRSTPAEIFGICELPGGNKGLTSLAGEFLSDLNLTDPFTYNMVVRESVRRAEIQKKIQDLPAHDRAIQRTIEQQRIDSWECIRNAKDNGDDWSRLRNEYLARMQPTKPIQHQHLKVPAKTLLNNCNTKLRRLWPWRSRDP
ncbi:hypothetical protein F5Y10DRAFT_258743 [Nemania abortiva]|nr:hypothetical protein F5Y10DRAFT_258743 [Nemania abortiva]